MLAPELPRALRMSPGSSLSSWSALEEEYIDDARLWLVSITSGKLLLKSRVGVPEGDACRDPWCILSGFLGGGVGGRTSLGVSGEADVAVAFANAARRGS